MSAIAWKIDRALIVLFALSSGAYKVSFGAADVAVYSHVHFSPTQTAVFGAIQAFMGLACLVERARVHTAIGLTVCNTVATMALFAADQRAFAWVSWCFVLMAAVVAFEPTREADRSPAHAG